MGVTTYQCPYYENIQGVSKECFYMFNIILSQFYKFIRKKLRLNIEVAHIVVH